MPSLRPALAAALAPWLLAATPAPADLDRAALVAGVLAANPEIARADAEADAMRSDAAAIRLPDPMWRVGAAPLSLGNPVPGLTVELAQELPLDGSVRLGTAAADARADAAQHRRAGSRVALALEASTLFDDWWLVHEALALNAEHRQLVAELRAAATGRYTVGQAPQSAPLEAEVLLARLETEAATLEAQRAGIAVRLDTLLHVPPDTPVGRPIPPEPPTDAIAEAAAQPPELAALGSEVDAAAAEARMAERAWAPDLTLSTSGSTMWGHADMAWMVEVGGDLPVRRAGRRAASDAADARLEAARDALAAAEDRAAEDAALARVELAAAAQRFHLLRDHLVPTARQRLGAARIAFETGGGAFGEVVDAERELLDAELGALEATADYHRHQARLDAAAGRLPGGAP